MAEYRVRFVAENGNDTTGDGTADNPFRLPSKAITDLGTLGGLHVNPGVVMIGEGDFTETATVSLTRNVIVQGVGTYSGGQGGTRWIRGHSGDFLKYDAGFDDWQHQYALRDFTIDGNKTGFPAVADLVTIKRPGFHCRLDRVNFRNSSGWGMVIEEGANNLHAYDLGFLGCDGGGIRHTATIAGGGFGQWCAYFGLQIDGVASGTADGVLIEQDKGSRSMFLFDFPEFETGFQNGIRTNLTGAATSVAIIVNSMVTQGTTVAMKETAGTNPALWIVNHASTSGQLFNGVNETDTSGNCGFATFGKFGGGSSRIQVGENEWISRQSGTPEGNEVGNIGDMCSRRDGGAGTSLYVKESGDGTNTGWSSVS
jgi:hypothetical protein